MEDERPGSVSDGAAFARSLDRLKREGSNILLVGTETMGAHETICRRLLGAADRDSVYRLCVTDGDTRTACERMCETVEPEPAHRRTIDYSRLETTGKAERTSGDDRPPLDALGTELVEAVDEFADAADGFAPAELRVCVDSLVPLCQEYETQTVFRLLHMVTARVDHARGMGHYHLPLARDREIVNRFEPLFDAVVTVRSRGGTPEQRWSLREPETTTDWLEL